MTTIPAYGTLVYNAENQLVSAGGVTYTYDGDGRRVMKSGGTIYWYGTGSDSLVETDLSGNSRYSFIYFAGKRWARHMPNNEVHFYFTDHLGSSSVFYRYPNLGVSDFYPFGGERVVLNNCFNAYKFTGKERDSESGLDNFIARYDSSNLGRFMSPDPSNYGAIDESPQTWNMYSYVANNPLNATDPNGLDCVYTQNFSKDGTVTVERGNCTQKGGTYVDGTIDTKSLTYNSKTNELGYSFSNAEQQTGGAGTISLGPSPNQNNSNPGAKPICSRRVHAVEPDEHHEQHAQNIRNQCCSRANRRCRVLLPLSRSSDSLVGRRNRNGTHRKYQHS
jgi:RHS repeat-associated protein